MTLLVARVAAVLVAVGTFAFLFLNDSLRSDNAFLVPDLVLCAGLVVGALLPAATARPVLVIGFAFAAGVLGTSAANDIVRDAFSPIALGAALVSLAAGVALVRGRARVAVPA
ncbi:hypothetical protein [Nakamurella alba]|uniref:hypothetical protein n=1 Tax=Nakamurella alba TaxID=2665158 RepID=UPI0018AB5FB7|nr:hypothetical protein [Nakamurella alba]